MGLEGICHLKCVGNRCVQTRRTCDVVQPRTDDESPEAQRPDRAGNTGLMAPLRSSLRFRATSVPHCKLRTTPRESKVGFAPLLNAETACRGYARSDQVL